MFTRRLLSLVPLGFVLATVVTSRAEAQVTRSRVIICRDGTRFDSDNASVCARHRGVDGRATENARRYEADRSANGRLDNRRSGDPRYDSRGQYDDRYGSGSGYGNGNGRNVVYEWQGAVDREIQIQLRGDRAFVQPVGAGDSRSGRGRMVSGLPHRDGTLVVQRLDGRGDVDVIAQPSARNGYTATIRVRDSRGGADNYRIVAYWQPAVNANGRYGYGRN
jgi:hypothetical protein